MEYTVNDIIVYPIKGLAGISLTSAVCEEKGFQFDRRYLIIDENNRFLSQREIPEMALFSVSLKEKTVTIKRGDSVLQLEFGTHLKKIVTSSIWSHEVNAYVVSTEANSWFTEKLGRKCQLVYMSDAVSRKKTLIKSPDTTELSFADGYPYTVIGTASIDFLNSKLETPIKSDRFRGSIIVNTSIPHEEDNWDHFYINGIKFRVIKPCARCQVVTIEQETAIVGKEPTKTLATYRKEKNSILFGANTICREPGQNLHIGDKITF